MEQYILECLDCHGIFHDSVDHTCRGNVNVHFTSKEDRAYQQVPRLDIGTVQFDKKSTSQEEMYNKSLTQNRTKTISATEETTSVRKQKDMKPICKTPIEQNRTFSVSKGTPFYKQQNGDSIAAGSCVLEPVQWKKILSANPILQDGRYINCTDQDASNFQSVSDNDMMDYNHSSISIGNKNASVNPSTGWNFIDNCEPLDVEAHKRLVDSQFVCPVCEKIIPYRSHFIIHFRIHTGERPYACEFCEKKFKTRQNLNKHIRIHTGEKIYPCDLCLKKFRTKHDMKRHRWTHTGEKPYKCRICEKLFIATVSRKKQCKNVCDMCQLRALYF